MGDQLTSLAPVLPVSLLVSSARLLIERHLGLAWISGEVSNFSRAGSGHCYFLLKDEQAQVRCVFFRHKVQLLDFALKDGLRVELRAVPTIYEARGEFQLNVETARLAGLGALYEKFAKLKARLEAAGWFRPERKRAVPAFPRAVGIVCSRHAAALRDVLTTLRRRMPALPVILYHAAVQGNGAASDIATAIATANAHGTVDVLIVCRGGGSIEDLWAFNEEAVARAVFESRIPVVSGVGHETDFTICDFVADLRAPTPTAAAAAVAPDRLALLAQVKGVAERWCRAVERSLELRMQRLDLVSRRLVHPAARLEAQQATIAKLAMRLCRAAGSRQRQRQRDLIALHLALVRLLRQPPRECVVLERSCERWRRGFSECFAGLSRRVTAAEQSLRHLSPQGVLDRGYSIITTPSGAIVQDAVQIALGDALGLRFARGEAAARVIAKGYDQTPVDTIGRPGLTPEGG